MTANNHKLNNIRMLIGTSQFLRCKKCIKGTHEMFMECSNFLGGNLVQLKGFYFKLNFGNGQGLLFHLPILYQQTENLKPPG